MVPPLNSHSGVVAIVYQIQFTHGYSTYIIYRGLVQESSSVNTSLKPYRALKMCIMVKCVFDSFQ